MAFAGYLFTTVAAGSNAAIYAHYHSTFNLGVAVFCGIVALGMRA